MLIQEMSHDTVAIATLIKLISHKTAPVHDLPQQGACEEAGWLLGRFCREDLRHLRESSSVQNQIRE